MSDNPEILCARRLIRIKKLNPPIDIEALIKDYADIEYTDIPFDIDGLCLNLKVKGKTRVIINKRISQTRRIFTLAHELGHIIIPWHVGSIIDTSVIEELAFESFLYEVREAEANRFASEILMPSEWVSGLFDKNNDPEKVMRYLISHCGVSAQAAILKMNEIMPSGYVYARTREQVVLWAGKTRGTISDPPPLKRIPNIRNFFATAQTVWNLSHGGEEYYWWKFGGQKAPKISDEGEWRSTLNKILDDLSIVEPERKSVWSSLNGFLAMANSRVKERNIDFIFDALLQKMESRTDVTPTMRRIVGHLKFEDFLVQKAASFLDTKN